MATNKRAPLRKISELPSNDLDGLLGLAMFQGNEELMVEITKEQGKRYLKEAHRIKEKSGENGGTSG